VDLPGLTRGGLNGDMSCKLLAQVDELNEVAAGDRGGIYRAAESLKALVTRETSKINPKYGRQQIELNCVRWLLFWNHDSALYLDEHDRRFVVIRNPETPARPTTTPCLCARRIIAVAPASMATAANDSSGSTA
jgi:hypothetical protein